MKKILIPILLISSMAFGQSNTEIAGDELLKYHNKKRTSIICFAASGLFMAMGASQKDAEPLIIMGGMIAGIGVAINISSLWNLSKSAKHFKAIR